MTSTTELTEEQEERRRAGLRILARIIARHYLSHPERYPEPGGCGGCAGEQPRGTAGDPADRTRVR